MNYSPTQINMFLRCSASWMFRYVENLKIPPNGNMSLGRAYHTGMETNGRYKIEKLEDMPTADVCDAFSFDPPDKRETVLSTLQQNRGTIIRRPHWRVKKTRLANE